jgi:sugar phosphate isomerase/epimerase
LELEKAFEQLAQKGVKVIEIFVNTHCELMPPYLSQMLELKNEYGIDVCAVHPFTCPIEPMMLFTRYVRRIADILDYYKRFFDYMNKFGAKYLVFHGNKNDNAVGNDFYFERFAMLQETARAHGVVTLQENVSRCTGGSLDFLKEMAEVLRDDALFVLDTKQAHRAGGDPMEYVGALKDHIKHIHFSDCGEAGDCLKLGDGDYDNAAFFSALANVGFDGCVVLELYRRNFESTEDLFRNYRLLQSAVDS